MLTAMSINPVETKTEKSKNISTNYVAALQVRTSESEGWIIDIDRRHVDLNSTE